MLAYFTVPTTWGQILKGVATRLLWGDAGQLAAQLAYCFMLALFPGLLFIVAFASLFPLAHVSDQILQILAPLVPSIGLEIIRGQLLRLAQGHDTGILSVGFIAAAWSGSTAISAIVSAMNRAYDIRDARPWWRVRLMAIALTIGLSIFVFLGLLLIVAGPEAAGLAARWLGFGPAFALAWKTIQWPLIVVLVATGVRLIYYFAPDAYQCWVWITPGTVLATGLALLGSLGFRFYVVRFGHYDVTYGAIGGMIVLLLWCYVTSFALVAGIELDAGIERAAPWATGTPPRIGTRRCIGGEAARRHLMRGEGTPSAE